MKRTEAGPGLLSIPVAEPVADARGPWWYEYASHEIVRYSDGRRWSADDVPELQRSLDEWATNPVVDVDEVDRWVLEQAEKP